MKTLILNKSIQIALTSILSITMFANCSSKGGSNAASGSASQPALQASVKAAASIVSLPNSAGNLGVCNAGYSLSSGSCYPNIRSCSIANGVGLQVFSGGAYLACTVSSCNSGYSFSGNACVIVSSSSNIAVVSNVSTNTATSSSVASSTNTITLTSTSTATSTQAVINPPAQPPSTSTNVNNSGIAANSCSTFYGMNQVFMMSNQAVLGEISVSSSGDCLNYCQNNPLTLTCLYKQVAGGSGSCMIYDSNLSYPLLNTGFSVAQIGATALYTFACSPTPDKQSGSPIDFTQILYANILQQSPTAAQYAAAQSDTSINGCVNLVNSVVTSRAAVQSFNADSLGYDIVNRMYHGILGRASDSSGFNFYWNVIVSQGTASGAAQIAAAMASSSDAEFVARCQNFGFKN